MTTTAKGTALTEWIKTKRAYGMDPEEGFEDGWDAGRAFQRQGLSELLKYLKGLVEAPRAAATPGVWLHLDPEGITELRELIAKAEKVG